MNTDLLRWAEKQSWPSDPKVFKKAVMGETWRKQTGLLHLRVNVARMTISVITIGGPRKRWTCGISLCRSVFQSSQIDMRLRARHIVSEFSWPTTVRAKAKCPRQITYGKRKFTHGKSKSYFYPPEFTNHDQSGLCLCVCTGIHDIGNCSVWWSISGFGRCYVQLTRSETRRSL